MKIKQIRKKTSNGFQNYDIGAKASNIQMLDGLNLQTELIHGNYKKEVLIQRLIKTTVTRQIVVPILNPITGQQTGQRVSDVQVSIDPSIIYANIFAVCDLFSSEINAFIDGQKILETYKDTSNNILFYNLILINKTSSQIITIWLYGDTDLEPQGILPTSISINSCKTVKLITINSGQITEETKRSV